MVPACDLTCCIAFANYVGVTDRWISSVQGIDASDIGNIFHHGQAQMKSFGNVPAALAHRGAQGWIQTIDL